MTAELASIAVRRIEVYEHPVLLRKGLDESKERLLIISPWIAATVVNDDFLQRLDGALRRRVRVHLGYGIDAFGMKRPDDRGAENRLVRLSEEFANFTMCRVGNTHAKVLIWDENWVNTSFNWLSFRGSRERTYRQEEGVLISVPALVDDNYRRYAAEIESSCQ